MTDTAPEPGVLLLYSFRYRDPRTGRWQKALYRAELDDPLALAFEREFRLH